MSIARPRPRLGQSWSCLFSLGFGLASLRIVGIGLGHNFAFSQD